MYDKACYELAQSFLEDNELYTEKRAHVLAQAIQDCIEGEIEDFRIDEQAAKIDAAYESRQMMADVAEFNAERGK